MDLSELELAWWRCWYSGNRHSVDVPQAWFRREMLVTYDPPCAL